MSKSKKFNLEKSLKDLENIIEKMDNGGLSLEESLKQFETGTKLANDCQQALTKAEQKVQTIMDHNNSTDE